MNVVRRESSVRPATERRQTRRARFCAAFALVALVGLGMAIVFALHAHTGLAIGAAVAALVFGAAAYMTDNDATEEEP